MAQVEDIPKASNELAAWSSEGQEETTFFTQRSIQQG
jgi:hypothetical protein